MLVLGCPLVFSRVTFSLASSCCLQAFLEAEHAAAQKEREKRQQALLNRWTKPVQGLRIRQRMHEQYGGGTHESGTPGLGNVGLSLAAASGNDDGYDGHDDEGGVQPATVGGFLTGVEGVVQPYSLPRPTHVVFSSPPCSPNLNGQSPLPALASPGTLASSSFPAAANEDDGEEREQQAPPSFLVEDVEELETDNMRGLELEGAQSQSTQRVQRMPKSMAVLAAEVEAQAQATVADASVVAVTPHKSEGEEAASTPTQGISRPTTTCATPRTRANTESKSKSTLTKRTGTRARARTPSRKRARTQGDDDDDKTLW